MQKVYPRRIHVEYKMFDSNSATRQKSMIRCECGKRFKKKKGIDICPKCGTEVTEETKVLHPRQDSLIWFNTSNVMFVDDDKITISMVMLSLCRSAHEIYPRVGEQSFRLRIRYDIKKRTAIAYAQNLRCFDEYWEHVKLPVKFLNFTQPSISKLDSYDIVLPDEMVQDFCEIIGVEKPDKLIGATELAWMNRTRLPLQEAMREREILTQFISKTFEGYNVDEEDVRYFKKLANKVKRHLKSGKKTKDYDESVFMALCRSYDVDPGIIPQNLIKYYYANPVALLFAEIHSKLFLNRDVRINAIMNETKDSSMIYSYDDYNFDTIRTIFGGEVNVLNKLKGNGNYPLLNDTAKMIDEIREHGHEFKTKGSLYSLHNKAWRLNMLVSVPRGIVFENTEGIEDFKVGGYNFIYAKTSDELIYLSAEMDICVASYYKYCKYKNTQILYVKDASNKPVACLEIKRGKQLVQAKAYDNTKINSKIQHAVLQFCNKSNIYIKTHDINASIREKNHMFLSELVA